MPIDTSRVSSSAQSHLDIINVLRDAQVRGRDVFVNQSGEIKALGRFGQLGFNIKKLIKGNEWAYAQNRANNQVIAKGFTEKLKTHYLSQIDNAKDKTYISTKFDKYVGESFEEQGMAHPQRWNVRHLNSLINKGVDAHHGDLPMVANAAQYGLAETFKLAMENLEGNLELRLLKHNLKESSEDQSY
jgi:hypothetical protein